MSELFKTLIVLSVAGSTIMACILVLNLISRNIFSAKWQYLIRKLALLFFLVPVLLIVRWFSFLSTEPNSIITSIQTGYWRGIIPEQYISFESALVFLFTWGIGTVLFGGWHVYCYRKFSKRIKSSNIPVPDDCEVYKLLDTNKKTMRIRHNVKLAYNNQIASPALIGFIKPIILLPTRKIPTVELNMVIRHELIHFKRKDLWMKMFMLVASSLHWFNPFVHILRKEMHIWSELSCDEEVVSEMSYAERRRYGETILNLLEDSLTTPAFYSAFLSGNKIILKKRLTMLLEVKPMKKFILAMATVIIISVGAIGITVSALASESPVTIDSVKTKQTILNTNDQKKEEVYTDSF